MDESEKKKHRIQIKNRTELQNVIPLDAPFVVYLDPSSACNFRCKFCPTGERDVIGKTTRWTGPMDLNIYKKAIDDLAEFSTPIKALKLYKDGEPLLNKHFAEMIAYAKASGSVNCIETTTNASLLTPGQTNQIITAGLDRVNISVYGMSDDDFLQFSRTKINFDEYLQNVRYFYANRGNCTVHIKTTIGISGRDTLEEFYQTFGPYCDSIDVENISPFWPGYDFQEKHDLHVNESSGTFGQTLEKKLVCPYVFYALAVNSDGQVDLCSCDWTHDYLIGDVRKQSLKEIWNSKELYNEQILQLKGMRMDHQLCKDCHEISYESVDNIDRYREDLLQRLKDHALQ
jgi:radical SAM protein with 4Fe4S-binding SPASM domain